MTVIVKESVGIKHQLAHFRRVGNDAILLQFVSQVSTQIRLVLLAKIIRNSLNRLINSLFVIYLTHNIYCF